MWVLEERARRTEITQDMVVEEYAKRAMIYYRVSGMRQAEEGLSLDAQADGLRAAKCLLDELRNRDEDSGFFYTGDKMQAIDDTIVILGNAEVRHKTAHLEAAEIMLERRGKVAIGQALAE